MNVFELNPNREEIPLVTQRDEGYMDQCHL
jgi:hypothetical protein